MRKRTKQQDRAKERFWRQVLKRLRTSQLSIREFCRREQLSEPSLYAWRRTLAQRDQRQAIPTARRSRPAPQFLPVAVVGASFLEVETPEGWRLRIPAGFDPATIAAVVAQLAARSVPVDEAR